MRYALRRWLPYLVPAGAVVGAAAGTATVWWIRRRRRTRRAGALAVPDTSRALVPHDSALVPATLQGVGSEHASFATSRPVRLRVSKRMVAAGAAVLVIGLASAWAYREHRVERQIDTATGGVAKRAIPIMLTNGCAGCHTIPGVPGAQGQVGPRLDSTLSSRRYLAGVVPNDKHNMIRWLRASREMAPHTAMPSTGISEQEARDVAAYLYAIR
jgi:cytochrome c2